MQMMSNDSTSTFHQMHSQLVQKQRRPQNITRLIKKLQGCQYGSLKGSDGQNYEIKIEHKTNHSTQFFILLIHVSIFRRLHNVLELEKHNLSEDSDQHEYKLQNH